MKSDHILKLLDFSVTFRASMCFNNKNNPLKHLQLLWASAAVVHQRAVNNKVSTEVNVSVQERFCGCDSSCRHQRRASAQVAGRCQHTRRMSNNEGAKLTQGAWRGHPSLPFSAALLWFIQPGRIQLWRSFRGKRLNVVKELLMCVNACCDSLFLREGFTFACSKHLTERVDLCRGSGWDGDFLWLMRIFYLQQRRHKKKTLALWYQWERSCSQICLSARKLMFSKTYFSPPTYWWRWIISKLVTHEEEM